MPRRRLAIVVALAFAAGLGGAACSDAKPPAKVKPRKPPTGGALSVKAGNPFTAADIPPDPEEQYIPAEFKAGSDRWRDTGVYLDGKPIAMLTWAELPLSLPVTWIQTKMSANKRYGHPEETGWRWGRVRRYKFTDYFKALGIDVRKIKEVHVYGPRFSDSIVATGKDLLGPDGDKFMFRFAGKTSGKPIADPPPGFGNGKSPDKVAGVMIYIKKKPPTLVRNVGFELDGVVQDGVPYFGEPLRGGVRVYLDDHLVAYIKRQDLPAAKGTPTPDGQLEWSLYDILAGQGVETSKVVEGWVIRQDKRQERIAADELRAIKFTAGSQAKGAILLGPQQLRVQSLALHTRALDPSTFPVRDDNDE
jgi:hypothetical protein